MSNREIDEQLGHGGKLKTLVGNTILFAVGTMGSRLLSLILLPMVTNKLTPTEASDANFVGYACNFILPLMYLCINEAVIRFGANKKTPAHDVYTTGIGIALIGFVITLIGFPIVKRIEFLTNYAGFFYAYILASALRTISSHFVRSQGHRRIFTFDGILTAALNFFFTWLFVIKMGMGPKGVLLATILSDGISVIFLTVSTRAWNFFSPTDLDYSVSKEMLMYSIPLVPAALSWMITNYSDALFIRYVVSKEDSGIYSYADRVPQLMLLISTVFIQAWQLSAFDESDGESREEFFSHVFNGYSALVFIAGSALILLIRPLSRILLVGEFYEAWKYSAVVIISVVFSCMVTFLGTIYNVSKKNIMVTVTTVGAAVFDVVLNAIMIPIWGIYGATVSTVISYIGAFLIRAIDTRRFIKLDIKPIRLILNTVLLIVQVLISVNQPLHGMYIQGGIILIIGLINIKPILYIAKQILGSIHKVKGNEG